MSDLTWTIDEPGSWQLDASHFPTPVTRWFTEILTTEFKRGFSEGSAAIGVLLSHMAHSVVNGFVYHTPRIVGAPLKAKGPPPRAIFALLTRLHPGMRRRMKTASRVFEARPWRDDLRRWADEVRPASTRAHLALQARDPRGVDDAGLAALLGELHANAHQQYYLHHRFTLSAIAPVGDYLAQAGAWTGLPPSELLQAVRQPRGVATDAQAQHDAAARAIAEDRGARDAIGSSRPPGEVLAELRARIPAVATWLELVSHRLVTGYDLVDVTAIELPALLVRTMQAALDGRDDRGAAAQARDAYAARVRDAVPAAHKDEFDALRDEALAVSNLREERALVCDFWAFGLSRRAALEAGRRVAARGRIAEPHHLLEADHGEMLALLRGDGGPTADELAARHRYRTTTSAEIAPASIGFAPAAPPPASWYPPATRRLNAAVAAAVAALFDEAPGQHDTSLVRGLNASAGVYEGRARLVLRPDEMERVERGDVLVARATTEAYNGIIPLLGAIVTDRGGLLSHAATVAREYGIPAIVGTQEATRLIPDGARVVVDGSRGEARLVHA